MEFLLYLGLGWLATIGISYGMLVATTAKLCKEAADNGYKFQVAKIDKEGLDVIQDQKQHMLVPFVNIIEMIMFSVSTKNPEFIEVLFREGRVIEMTKEEIEQYKSNPTALNAISISMNSSRDSQKRPFEAINSNVISINDNTIEFVVRNKNVYIVGVQGEISKLKEETQGEILMDCLECMLEMAKQNGIPATEFDKKLEDGEIAFSINVNKKTENDNSNKDSHFSKEEYYFLVKKYLYEFREQLVNGNIKEETEQGKKPKQKI